MNADGDAVIRDLGITRVRLEVVKSLDERLAGFSPRYQAPELMAPPPTTSSGASVKSRASHLETSLTVATDAYSVAMTFYHLITHTQPFHATSHPTLTSPSAVLRAVLDGERPPAPPLAEHRVQGAGGNIYDEDLVIVWGTLQGMWDADPTQRPSMATVATKFMALENRPVCQCCINLHRVRFMPLLIFLGTYQLTR